MNEHAQQNIFPKIHIQLQSIDIFFSTHILIKCSLQLSTTYYIQVKHYSLDYIFNICFQFVINVITFNLDKSVVASAPTGSGKTVIFELAIVNLLIQLENSNYNGDFKIIYSEFFICIIYYLSTDFFVIIIHFSGAIKSFMYRKIDGLVWKIQ